MCVRWGGGGEKGGVHAVRFGPSTKSVPCGNVREEPYMKGEPAGVMHM